MRGIGLYHFGLALVLVASPAVASPVQFKALYQFTSTDGNGDALVSDRNGGFFGITDDGGTGACIDGCGTVYHLTPPSNTGAPWTKTTLYNFAGYPNDGVQPYGPLVVAANGMLYGVTQQGGNGCVDCGGGTVYSLTPPAVPGGAWTETVLYSFTGGSDGLSPAHLIAGPDGMLYGVTSQGANSDCGQLGCGTAFSLTPPAIAGGPWIFDLLYTFTGDYFAPRASSVTLGPDGILYGTTSASVEPCYEQECGTVFSLTPPATPGGAWTATVLHSFTGWPADGNSPNPSLLLGPRGELYGTTNLGASHPCGEKHAGCGTVFELTPPASPGGDWTETILFTFPGDPAGNHPTTGVVMGKDGTMYGSTQQGGHAGCLDDFGCGTIYALTPPASPAGTWTETVLHYFTGGQDGGEPFMTPVIGKDGALYGTTGLYGSSGYGTFFIIRNP